MRTAGSLAFSLLVALYMAGCPNDTKSTDTTHNDNGGTASTAATAGDHGTGDHGGGDHGGHDHSVGTSGDDPAVMYCSCMLDHCHEHYHTKWGEDEMAAEQACLMEADSLPMNGGDIDMGDFIECRQHYCDQADTMMKNDDDTLCTNALGDAVCM